MGVRSIPPPSERATVPERSAELARLPPCHTTHGRHPRRSRALAAIGRTPLVDVALRVDGRWRRVGLKLESHNPAGSIKDRTAYSLIRSLECMEELRPGDRLVESTSGNLGVALALIGATPSPRSSIPRSTRWSSIGSTAWGRRSS
jgi:hypothetical protein